MVTKSRKWILSSLTALYLLSYSLDSPEHKLSEFLIIQNCDSQREVPSESPWSFKKINMPKPTPDLLNQNLWVWLRQVHV